MPFNDAQALPVSLLNKTEQASQAELEHQGVLSYLKNVYIFEILAKNCSKYESPSQIRQFLSKVGTSSAGEVA